jgi:cell division protein FtsB
MKILAIVILCILLVLVGIQIFSFFKQEHDLSQALADAQARLLKAQQNEASLSATMQYLANPANLAKELRSHFNYKKPGETMIVIVPSTTSTTNQ